MYNTRCRRQALLGTNVEQYRQRIDPHPPEGGILISVQLVQKDSRAFEYMKNR